MKKLLLSLLVVLAFSAASIASATSDYDAGKKAFEAKNYTQAVTYYESAIKQNTKYAEAYYGKGEAEMEPNSSDGYYGRGSAYAAKSEWEKAKKDLDLAVKYDPNNYEKYIARAMTLYELKQKEAAYADVEKAIQLAPNEPLPYRIRGLFKLGDLQFRAARADFSLGKKVEISKGS